MEKLMRRQFSAIRVIAATLALAACGGEKSATEPPASPPPSSAQVASIVITPATGSVVVGRTLTLTALAKDAQGRDLPGRAISWSSAAEGIVTVNASGLASAIAIGTAKITATSEGKSAEAALTVVPVVVASVRISPDTLTLKLSESKKLVAEVKDDQGNLLTDRAIRWSSNNIPVAIVDSISGVVAGADDGVATISATVDGKSATGLVRVHSPVASVTVTQTLDTLEAWDVRQMQATLRDAKGRVLTGRDMSWTVSDTSVASLLQTGALTGLDRGTVTVT